MCAGTAAHAMSWSSLIAPMAISDSPSKTMARLLALGALLTRELEG